MRCAADIAAILHQGAAACDGELSLRIDDWPLRVRCNSPALLERLRRYFTQVASGAPAPAEAVELTVLERPAPTLDLDFANWSREAGKRGRKDSYADLADGRVIHKVRTGMVFLQSQGQRIAAGPCLANDNQVINFIINQYMNALQQRDWLICHAAALVGEGGALALAGFSGGGKSTLMLHLMAGSMRFLSNDRLFIRRDEPGVAARGVPKLPRVNPGTLLNNPRLRALLDPRRRAECEALSPAQLWELEEKYDVPIADIYGRDRFASRGPLAALLVLNWRHGSGEPTQIEPVELASRRDLLAAIMKSPGPFYCDSHGRFPGDRVPLDEERYLAALAGVPVYEARGAVDFTRAAEHCRLWLGA
ncbi:HprK-related kinase B [Parahaliea mediterranea]|uniref:HprK-related kinase B n=1 Tax=Parahaliea mediterranea TaxID=651086 RepID=A0A939DGR2_9GAMM|nr:HprK-related kinase B [Parahaliea mediterranea]MBN7797561.1 HprK-related kinase B [Parahaliea mediterranea]